MKEKSVVLFPSPHKRRTENSYCKDCKGAFVKTRKRQTKCHKCCDISKLQPLDILIREKKRIGDYKSYERREYQRLWSKNKNNPCKG